MNRTYKKILAFSLILLLLLSAMVLYFRNMVPPGEEWISWDNEDLLTSIDRQLEGMDMERLEAEKEQYVLEKSLDELQQSVMDSELTYEELTALCLYRIKKLDQCRHGYNSVAEIAPDAMEQARTCDAIRKQPGASGRQQDSTGQQDTADFRPPSPLFGIPVMFKDNINTRNIPTSFGAEAYSDYIPAQDAPLVRTLREQGAVILGKNNLSEFANYMSSIMAAGYSGNKGQTVNPYGPLKISPSGSSSGSAVSVTANLVPVSIGTETAGSIAGPAAASSVVGFKPSRDRISAEGIMPLIHALDTPGPIAKTVQDAALSYDALLGLPGTAASNPAANLNPDALKGAGIGLAVYAYNDPAMISRLRDILISAGAHVTEIPLEGHGVRVQTVIHLTFKQEFQHFAEQNQLPITKLGDLLDYNRQAPIRRMRYGQDHLEAAEAITVPDYSPIHDSIQKARQELDTLMESYDLDSIAFLNTSASDIVCAAGYPELTVPLGLNDKGRPQGATFTAGYGQDRMLLDLGFSFQQTAAGRTVP